MAKTDAEILEEFLFYKEENVLLRDKVINLYNDFLGKYREFLAKDYAELTIYEAIQAAQEYAIAKDEEEGGSFYTELLADWYDEQVADWKERLKGMIDDYMIETVSVIDEEESVDWGEYIRPVIYDVNDWGYLLSVGDKHLVENDTKGLEHIVMTVEYFNFPIYSEEDFNNTEELKDFYKNYKRYEELLLKNNITATDTWKFALDPDFQYDKWAGRKVNSPEDALTLAHYLNQCLNRIESDLDEIQVGLQKAEQLHLYLKENYLDEGKSAQAFKTWISTKGYE